MAFVLPTSGIGYLIQVPAMYSVLGEVGLVGVFHQIQKWNAVIDP